MRLPATCFSDSHSLRSVRVYATNDEQADRDNCMHIDSCHLISDRELFRIPFDGEEKAGNGIFEGDVIRLWLLGVGLRLQRVVGVAMRGKSRMSLPLESEGGRLP